MAKPNFPLDTAPSGEPTGASDEKSPASESLFDLSVLGEEDPGAALDLIAQDPQSLSPASTQPRPSKDAP